MTTQTAYCYETPDHDTVARIVIAVVGYPIVQRPFQVRVINRDGRVCTTRVATYDDALDVLCARRIELMA